ncbi:NAD(P)-binding protein [Trichoderma citrinoviride]|uniref:NAD(P)-binding protein n=1 Tax=Trichoderma citrinoviride TaxID=58853 RepID=A0A2T4B173_9HYPO|nr:NAD(P)-binding protein [Trichoderma citrinoviride]PTB63069.1 NAD(P)-binding protein [Trichoderma citrinoviride]
MSSQLESDAPSEATTLGFLRRQFTRPKPLPADLSLAGKVAIVTGSNVGLGFSACRQLLQLGLSHLVMAVRSQAKGDAAAAELRREFASATVSVWIVDMESYDSVRAFAARCESLSRIDIVILNAGLTMAPYTVVSATGHEITLQVNYLSTALLTILLLPILKAKKIAGSSQPPVISVVGSDAMYQSRVELHGPILPQFQRQDKFTQFTWYGNTKLLQALFVSKVAEFVSPRDVIVNVSNPGMTDGTEFFRGLPAWMKKLIGAAQWMLARSVDVGASTYLDAVLVQGEKSHGSFTSDWTIKPFPKIWYTPEGKKLTERLWEETMEELSFVGASKIMSDLRQSWTGDGS